MTAAIDQPYGNDLATMAERISGVIDAFFVDADGFVLACINAETNKPFVDDDWQIRDLEAHATWYARGSFPFALKRTAMNYEDADMTTGELLMAFLARARAVPNCEHRDAVERLAGVMIGINETIAAQNPMGAGFLPKTHGGVPHVHECFETSADQYLKWAVALEAYSVFTAELDRRVRAERILLDMAGWLDAHDFCTPYMGDTNYARLNHLRHYHLAFAYLCALGHRLGGSEHLLEEVVYFKNHAATASTRSPSPNSQNLVAEALSRLLDLAPEHSDDWLALMRDDWDARHAFVTPDLRVRFTDHYWNHTARFATNYWVVRKHVPEVDGTVDVEEILLAHDGKAAFLHLAAGQERTGLFASDHYPRYDTYVSGMSYASWLRVYWETRGAGV